MTGRRPTRTGVFAAFALSAMVAALVGCASATPSGETWRIGAVTSLTGSYASMGDSAAKALELEAERINESGGIAGRPVEILIEDDGTDVSRAVASAAKLIERDEVVALIGATGTGTSMAVRGDVDRAGVVQISPAGGTAIVANFDPLVFQTPWSNRIVIPFVLEHVRSSGHNRIALLSDAGGYGRDGRTLILEEAPRLGIEIVSDETFNAGDTDMTAQLVKARAAQADALVVWAAGKEATTIAKNKVQLGYDVPWFGGSGQARVEFVQGAGADAEGFVFATGKSLVPDNWVDDDELRAVNEDFARRYRERYGEDPDIFAGHAFDAIRLIEDALKRVDPDHDVRGQLKAALEKTRDLPGYGGRFTYSIDDHNGLTPDDLALYVVRGGKWVLLR